MPKRMFAEGEFGAAESGREAAHRVMAALDEEAAKHGMAVTGPVEILASDPNPLTGVRAIRLEADVVSR